MKKLIIASAALAVILTGAAIAQEKDMDVNEEQQASSIDQIIESCEARYSADEYADEAERNTLIDQCVDAAKKTQEDQG